MLTGVSKPSSYYCVCFFTPLSFSKKISLVIINMVAFDAWATSITIVAQIRNPHQYNLYSYIMSFAPMHVLGTPLYTISGNKSLPHMNIVASHYRYLQDLLQLESHKPVSSTLSWPRCPTSIQVEGLRRYLHVSYHPASFICTSLYNSFHVGFHSLSLHHSSSVANPAVV